MSVAYKLPSLWYFVTRAWMMKCFFTNLQVPPSPPEATINAELYLIIPLHLFRQYVFYYEYLSNILDFKFFKFYINDIPTYVSVCHVLFHSISCWSICLWFYSFHWYILFHSIYGSTLLTKKIWIIFNHSWLWTMLLYKVCHLSSAAIVQKLL